eukprot:COSAG02_NODE_150_length_33596_cov_61.953966_9_plen_53_part_00
MMAKALRHPCEELRDLALTEIEGSPLSRCALLDWEGERVIDQASGLDGTEGV